MADNEPDDLATTPHPQHNNETMLLNESDLPRQVQFAWHGVNDECNLRQFLASNVLWGEVDVRRCPSSGQLLLRHDPLGPNDPAAAELLPLAVVLDAMRAARKSIKIDLKEAGPALTESIAAVKTAGFDNAETWFNADYRLLGRQGFAAVRETFPGAIIQCPIDSITPLILGGNQRGMEQLAELRQWGLTRFSAKWDKPNMARLLAALDAQGYELNIYNVPDLPAFIETALLLPRSITSDFNFPQWNYFGRGSGQGGRYHEYPAEEKLRELLTQPAAL